MTAQIKNHMIARLRKQHKSLDSARKKSRFTTRDLRTDARERRIKYFYLDLEIRLNCRA